MPLWLQHVLVLSIAAGCLAFLVRQTVASLRGTGKLGSCCAKGCGGAQTETKRTVIVHLGVRRKIG